MRLLEHAWRTVAPLTAPLVLVMLVGLLWVLVLRRPVVVTASSTDPAYATFFLAENVLDRAPSSFWIPEADRGDVDIRFRRHRVDWILVRNGDNHPHGNAGTREFAVVLKRDGRAVYERVSRFTRAGQDVQRFETGGVEGDEILVRVRSSIGRQACLADIDWGPR